MISKIPCGYVFSDQPLQYLNEAGFHLSIENLPELGCRRALIPLRDAQSLASGLVIYEVLDEESFINKTEARGQQGDKVQFTPHLIELPTSEPPSHPNSVDRLVKLVDSQHLQNEPWDLYLTLRKTPGILAVILSCQDRKKLPSFDKQFEFQGRPYGLIHLGPNCFDILITF